MAVNFGSPITRSNSRWDYPADDQDEVSGFQGDEQVCHPLVYDVLFCTLKRKQFEIKSIRKFYTDAYPHSIQTEELMLQSGALISD